MGIDTIIDSCRNYRGFSRKNQLGELLEVFGDFSLEDAGYIEIDGGFAVASTDGIVEDIVKHDPFLAGFYSVVVNVNDVVAKGARPVGYMNVISSRSRETRLKIARGVKAGLDIYNLRLLKGHTHPDQGYDSIDAAVIGLAKRVIRSRGAKANDEMLVAIDLDGSATYGTWVRCFDSVSSSSRDIVSRKLSCMKTIAEKQLATASRDISVPGIVGSVSMMCESSGVGVHCDLEKIPRPTTIDLVDWLTTYPSIGFIVSTEDPDECCEIFGECGLSVGRAGVVAADRKIVLELKGEKGTFMDLNRDSMFGLRS